jgi:hypothetical protein
MGKYADQLANIQRSKNIQTIQNNHPHSSMPTFKDGCIHQDYPEAVLREERIRLALKSVMRPDSVATKLASRIDDLSKLEDKNDDGSLVSVESLTEDLIRHGLSGLSVATIANLMEDEEVPPAIRLASAKYILDRILGKPTQREEVSVTTQEFKINISLEPPSIKKEALDGIIVDADFGEVKPLGLTE